MARALRWSSTRPTSRTYPTGSVWRAKADKPRPCLLPLFTGVRGRGILRSPQPCIAPLQTSPLNVRRIGGVTMAENHSPTRPPITGKPHRCQADEDPVARFICHVNSTHVLHSLWRGLVRTGGLQLHCSYFDA